jgi:hypothetical protein
VIEDEILRESAIIEKLDGVVGIMSKTGLKEVVIIDKVGMRSKRLFVIEHMTVLTIFINVFVDSDSSVFEGIVEVVIVAIDVVVEDGGVPRRWGGHYLVREGFHFLIRGWSHGNVWESVGNADGADVTIFGSDALRATNFDGSIVDVMSGVFKLWRGMNGTSLTNVGIVVKDTDDGTRVGAYNTSNNSKGNVAHLVIFDPGDIDDSVGDVVEFADISSTDTAVGSPINKRSIAFVGNRLGDVVINTMYGSI